jgi:hypothetical protein
VPGKCTDVLQECDTVINKPFKSGCKDGFTAYVQSLFTTHMEKCRANTISDADAVGSFRPALTVGKLKPVLPSFVISGLAKLKTEDMCKTIKHAFAEHGQLKKMREIAETMDESTTTEISTTNPTYTVEGEEEREEIDQIGLLDEDNDDADLLDDDSDSEDEECPRRVRRRDNGVAEENEELDVTPLILRLGLFGLPNRRDSSGLHPHNKS